MWVHYYYCSFSHTQVQTSSILSTNKYLWCDQVLMVVVVVVTPRYRKNKMHICVLLRAGSKTTQKEQVTGTIWHTDAVMQNRGVTRWCALGRDQEQSPDCDLIEYWWDFLEEVLGQTSVLPHQNSKMMECLSRKCLLSPQSRSTNLSGCTEPALAAHGGPQLTDTCYFPYICLWFGYWHGDSF